MHGVIPCGGGGTCAALGEAVGTDVDQGHGKETEGKGEEQSVRDQSPVLAPANVPPAVAVPVPFAFSGAACAASSAMRSAHFDEVPLTCAEATQV